MTLSKTVRGKIKSRAGQILGEFALYAFALTVVAKPLTSAFIKIYHSHLGRTELFIQTRTQLYTHHEKLDSHPRTSSFWHERLQKELICFSRANCTLSIGTPSKMLLELNLLGE